MHVATCQCLMIIIYWRYRAISGIVLPKAGKGSLSLSLQRNYRELFNGELSDMKIALTGASGFIGGHIRRRFNCIVIKRYDDAAAISEKLSGVDCLINLAGAPIIRRWTKGYKKILWDSRIETAKKLSEAIKRLTTPSPHTQIPFFISVSAIGIYPDGIPCDEGCHNTSNDFLGRLCKAWEQEAMKADCPIAIFRLGMVLGRDGGALGRMLPIFRLGLGGQIGNGSMITSWIHIDDLIDAMLFIADNRIQGIFNGVSPNPVTNREFTKILAKKLKRPMFFPVPQSAVRLLFGEGATAITSSKEVYPKRLIEKGFTFNFPNLDMALDDLL